MSAGSLSRQQHFQAGRRREMWTKRESICGLGLFAGLLRSCRARVARILDSTPAYFIKPDGRQQRHSFQSRLYVCPLVELSCTGWWWVLSCDWSILKGKRSCPQQSKEWISKHQWGLKGRTKQCLVGDLTLKTVQWTRTGPIMASCLT
jgi:hypothetical protein